MVGGNELDTDVRARMIRRPPRKFVAAAAALALAAALLLVGVSTSVFAFSATAATPSPAPLSTGEPVEPTPPVPTTEPTAPPPTVPPPTAPPATEAPPTEEPGEETTETPVPTETEPAPTEIAPVPVEPTAPTRPATPPAVATSDVSWWSIAIAVGSIGGSLLIIMRIVRSRRRRGTTQEKKPLSDQVEPQTEPISVVDQVAASDVLDAMAAVGEAMVDSGYPVTLVRSVLADLATANNRPHAEIVVFPTALMISVDDDENGVLTRAVSAGDESYLLHQIDSVDRVVSSARSRPNSARWVSRQLARIREIPPPFTRLQRVAGYVVLSGGISVLLGASWMGVAAAVVLGGVVGALLLVGERVPSAYQALVTIGAAFFVALTIFLLARASLDPGVLAALMAPLIILLPGGQLTTGVIELATGHFISGAARLAAGGMRLVLLALGIVSAAALVGVPAIDLAGSGGSLGPVAPWVAVAVFGAGLCVHLCARPRSIGWILLVLYVAYGAQVLGDVLFGGVLSAFIGAVAMTPVAVFVARQRSGPPTIVSFLPAFWLLVPGSLGLVGVTAVLDGDSTGTDTLVTTVSTMVSIALGVLIGLALARTFRTKQTTADEVATEKV